MITSKMMMPTIKQMRIFMSCCNQLVIKQSLPYDKQRMNGPYLPPHLLADLVGTATETLCTNGEVIGLGLKSIDPFTTLRDLVDVFAHHSDGVIDLLEFRQQKSQEGVLAWRGATTIRL